MPAIMTDYSPNAHDLQGAGDRLRLCAQAAELLFEATDVAEAGRALFDLIAAELKLSLFLLYVTTGDGGLELVAHCGLPEVETAKPAAKEERARRSARRGGAWFEQRMAAADMPLGLIGFGRRRAGSFQEDDLVFLRRVSNYFARALGRLRAEAALRKSEERLRLGMAVTGFGTFDLDLVTRRFVFSPALYAMLGLPPNSTCIIEELRKAVHPDDRQRVEDARLASLDPDGPGEYSMEHRVIRPDGALRWVHVRTRTFFSGESGARRPVRVIGVEQDITEAKLAEQRLRSSEERLRLATEAAGLGTFDYDMERDEIVWSPRLKAIYGIGPEENVDREFIGGRFHPDDRQRMADALFGDPPNEPGRPGHSQQYRIFRPDGEMRWLAIKATWLSPGTAQQPSRRLIGVVQDITEQKLAAERLRESERRLQLAQELGGVASWEWDQATNETWVSESFRRIFGLAPAAPLNAATFKSWLHPDDRERVIKCFTEIAEDAESLEIEYRIIRSHDQKLRWIYSMVGVVRDPLTGQIRLSGIAMDITGRKHDEERERLLSREVDHRAKNLLSIVQAMVQLTQADSIPDFVDQVTGRIHALGRVHGLLAASRWDGAELANLIVDELAPFADGPDRSRLTGPSIGLKPGAAQSMALVIHELTTNAVKHGALASPRGRVDISWAIGPAPDGQLVLNWCESGGATVEAPRRFGFGMTHIRASVERQLSGTIEMNWRAEGLQCVLTLPARQFAQPSH
jgi:PAS domain S-box-containing protein